MEQFQIYNIKASKNCGKKGVFAKSGNKEGMKVVQLDTLILGKKITHKNPLPHNPKFYGLSVKEAL